MEKACLLLPLKLNYCMTGHALLWNGPGFPDQKDPMQEHAGPKASKVSPKSYGTTGIGRNHICRSAIQLAQSPKTQIDPGGQGKEEKRRDKGQYPSMPEHPKVSSHHSGYRPGSSYHRNSGMRIDIIVSHASQEAANQIK